MRVICSRIMWRSSLPSRRYVHSLARRSSALARFVSDFGLGLLRAIVVYVLSLVGVFVVAYIIDFLAGTFGAQKNLDNAMRVSAYSPTAAWLAGVFNLIPALAFLGILGLYSLYLLYTGIAGLMRPAADKALVYTIAVIVCAIIVWIIIFSIPALLFGMI